MDSKKKISKDKPRSSELKKSNSDLLPSSSEIEPDFSKSGISKSDSSSVIEIESGTETSEESNAFTNPI